MSTAICNWVGRAVVGGGVRGKVGKGPGSRAVAGEGAPGAGGPRAGIGQGHGAEQKGGG
jgi:hypothetical protein